PPAGAGTAARVPAPAAASSVSDPRKAGASRAKRRRLDTVHAPARDCAPATLSLRADVAELVDAHGSGPCGRKLVEVQVLSSASLESPLHPGLPGQCL